MSETSSTAATAATVLRWIAIPILAIPVFPQIYHNYRRKSIHGVSMLLFLMAMYSALIYAAYAIHAQIALAVIIQSHVYTLSCVFLLFQMIFYGQRWRLKPRFIQIMACIMVLSGVVGSELLAYYLLVLFQYHGWTFAPQLYSILCTILAMICFLPQIITIVKLKSATGLSSLFLVFGITGYSMILIAFALQRPFDWLSALSYFGSDSANAFILGLKVYYDGLPWKKQASPSSPTDLSLEQGGLENEMKTSEWMHPVLEAVSNEKSI